MKAEHITILIVEPDEVDQATILGAFSQMGVKDPIHIVNDGGEAIAYLEGEGKFADRDKYQYPSFILTDLKMPSVDGFDVLAHLKRHPLWGVIPTVAFSASEDPDDIKTAYQLGASCYHVKPTQPEELRALLKQIYEYWLTCEVPQVDVTGKQVHTEHSLRLGER